VFETPFHKGIVSFLLSFNILRTEKISKIELFIVNEVGFHEALFLFCCRSTLVEQKTYLRLSYIILNKIYVSIFLNETFEEEEEK